MKKLIKRIELNLVWLLLKFKWSEDNRIKLLYKTTELNREIRSL